MSRTGGYQSYSHSFQGDDLQDLVGQLTARALAGMEGIDYNRHFQDMMQRLEYAFFPEQSVEEQMNEMMERYNLPRMGEQPEALKVIEFERTLTRISSSAFALQNLAEAFLNFKTLASNEQAALRLIICKSSILPPL